MEHLKIGDKVKTNGLMSPSVYGKIVCVQIGYMYYGSLNRSYNPIKWFQHDKEWLHKPVYTIEKELPDLSIYINDPDIPQEIKENTVKKTGNMGLRYTTYLPDEVEKLPDDYDWTQEVLDSLFTGEEKNG